MCLPKKTIVQYKNAIKEVKQKLKTVELEWQNLDKAVKKDFVNVELYKNDDIHCYDCLLNEAYSSTSSFYPNTDLVRQLRKLFAGI
jgi:hypothetical protein